MGQPLCLSQRYRDQVEGILQGEIILSHSQFLRFSWREGEKKIEMIQRKQINVIKIFGE